MKFTIFSQFPEPKGAWLKLGIANFALRNPWFAVCSHLSG